MIGPEILGLPLPNLLLDSMPPDPELVDLIEQAFIDGLIDSEQAELMYLGLMRLNRDSE